MSNTMTECNWCRGYWRPSGGTNTDSKPTCNCGHAWGVHVMTPPLHEHLCAKCECLVYSPAWDMSHTGID
jgi:hypothetical protein